MANPKFSNISRRLNPNAVDENEDIIQDPLQAAEQQQQLGMAQEAADAAAKVEEDKKRQDIIADLISKLQLGNLPAPTPTPVMHGPEMSPEMQIKRLMEMGNASQMPEKSWEELNPEANKFQKIRGKVLK